MICSEIKQVIIISLAGLIALGPETVSASISSQQNLQLDYVQAQSSEIDDLRLAINSGDWDLIVLKLNQVKRSRDKGRVLPYIQSLWQEKREVDNGLNWDIVSSPLVKLELANILLQATKNGFIDTNIQDVQIG